MGQAAVLFEGGLQGWATVDVTALLPSDQIWAHEDFCHGFLRVCEFLQPQMQIAFWCGWVQLAEQ